MSFSNIESLIRSEQYKQSGQFLETDCLDTYLSKIKSKAEIITHYVADECAGFVAFYCNDERKELAYISLILLSPKFRGRGIAYSLLDYVFCYCKASGFIKCGLEVKKTNHKAISLYEKFGFIVENSLDDKYFMTVNL